VRAPRVLVSGVVLAQPMSGVVRHNRELLPRVARLLESQDGRLALMEGRDPVPFELPDSVERLPSDVPPGPALRRAALEGRALRRCLTDGAFDLVHTAHLPVPRVLPVPFTVTLHDLKSLTLRSESLVRRLLGPGVVGHAVARAAGVIVVSETLARELCERFHVAPERVHVVPNGADHLPLLPRRPGPDAPLVQVGHLERRKNVELVLRALALDPALPSLQLAGAPRGDEDLRLRARAAELGVAERVDFLGLLEDAALAELYARAACVVFPSVREGFGIPAAEAQRAGVPLAISTSPALVEVAGAGVPTFDPDDPAACARAIHAALAASEGDLRAAAARAARYSWDRAAELWVAAWCAAHAAA
jgi:glycosyltransferase involved in cell wall biosynthesis